MHRAAAPLTCLVALAVAGCSGVAAPTAPTAPFDPVAELGPCQAPTESLAPPPDIGRLLPSGALVTASTADGPVTRLEGYVPATPVAIRRGYEQGRGDVRLLAIEDEVVETEALVGDGTSRAYLQFIAVCDAGSRMVGIVGPELASTDLPSLPGVTPEPTSPTD